MRNSINLRAVHAVILGGILLGFIPYLFFPFLAILSFYTTAFMFICIVDFIMRSAIRKSTGLVLAGMFLMAITSLLVVALRYYLVSGI